MYYTCTVFNYVISLRQRELQNDSWQKEDSDVSIAHNLQHENEFKGMKGEELS